MSSHPPTEGPEPAIHDFDPGLYYCQVLALLRSGSPDQVCPVSSQVRYYMLTGNTSFHRDNGRES
jgi:hypothetical protein